MKLKNIIAFVALVTTFSACDDLFEPALENVQTIDQLILDAPSAHGILGYAYATLPFETKSTTDIATDDAVTNDLENSYRSIALGSWTSSVETMSKWVACKATIQYINVFIETVEKIKFSSDPQLQIMFADRVTGEAYALRALNMYYLLRNHGGWVGGQLMGVPIVNESEGPGSDFNRARNTYQECVDQIFADVEKALELLPMDFEDRQFDSEVPKKYQDVGVEYIREYNTVFGSRMRGRMCGLHAKVVRAQTALLASSPAFAEGTTVTSEDAAKYAAEVIDHIGGLAGMDPKGHVWYMQTKAIEDLGAGANLKEILWRGNKNEGTQDYEFGINQELTNFPPTLYGNGRINPTQNLVDAFPMANGYPIKASGSGYSANDPYAGRDPRLTEYVLYNGAMYKNTEIITGSYSTDDNGLNKIGTSTRTGYYLRKLLREDCNPDPDNTLALFHFPVYMRATEIYLAYAEAANEAWGPKNSGTNAYSAYDVIKAIRQRAGIGAGGVDPYLDACAGDQALMRDLIRNERRIELCFENKRFWDMRRWKLNITEGAKGMDVTQQNGVLKYNIIDVEDRKYKDYMYYGPIPFTEVQRWSNLDQNTGWN